MFFVNLMLNFIPFVVLFTMACEVYYRSEKSFLHRITAVIFLLLGFIFLSSFSTSFVPMKNAVILDLIFKYLSAFVLMTLAIYFYSYSTKYPIKGWKHLFPLAPLLGILVVVVWPTYFNSQIVLIGAHRMEELSLPFLAILTFGTIYTFFGIAYLLIKGYIRMGRYELHDLYGKRLTFMIRGSVQVILLISLAFIIVVVMDAMFQVNLSSLIPYATLVFAFTVRRAMVNFDFLAQSDYKYKVLFNISSDGFLLINASYKIVEVNPAFCEMIGKEREVLINKDAFQLLSDLDGKGYEQDFREAIKSRQSIDGEICLKGSNGKTLITEVKGEFVEIEDVRHLFISHRDITSQKEKDAKLHYLAFHDPLTGLGNRRLFYDRFQDMQKAAQQTAALLAIGLIDLNKFKSINDRFGHATGDKVIEHVATHIKASLPEGAHASRMGGDEFAIILLAKNEADLDLILKRLAANINQSILVKEGKINISGSIGISIVSNTTDSVDVWLQHADQSMYEVKNGENLSYLVTH